MRLAALIAAFAGENGEVAALRPLGGVSLLERQLRLVHDLGADRLVLIGDVASPALSQALATLRARGLAAEAVSDLAGATDRLGEAERVLLLADGALPGAALAARVAAAPVPALAVLAQADGLDRYERIDADARWAGIALVDGPRIAETAAMVGEWDPVSTLLRRVVQEDGARIAADVPPLLGADPLALAAAERALLAGADTAPDGWHERWIEAPAARALLPIALEREVAATTLGWSAAGLCGLGALLAATGWRWVALLPLLASGPLAALARRIGAVQARPLRDGRPQALIRTGALSVAALGFAAELARTSGQWGWALTGVLLVGAMAALGRLRRRPGSSTPEWSAHMGALPWVLLPFALAGLWPAGLAAVALYALASLVAAFLTLD